MSMQLPSIRYTLTRRRKPRRQRCGVSSRNLLLQGKPTIPIAAEYPLDEVARAYRDVASRHGFGKRVLKLAVGE